MVKIRALNELILASYVCLAQAVMAPASAFDGAMGGPFEQVIPVRESAIEQAKLPDDNVIYQNRKIKITVGNLRAVMEKNYRAEVHIYSVSVNYLLPHTYLLPTMNFRTLKFGLQYDDGVIHQASCTMATDSVFFYDVWIRHCESATLSQLGGLYSRISAITGIPRGTEPPLDPKIVPVWLHVRECIYHSAVSWEADISIDNFVLEVCKVPFSQLQAVDPGFRSINLSIIKLELRQGDLDSISSSRRQERLSREKLIELYSQPLAEVPRFNPNANLTTIRALLERARRLGGF